LFLQSYLLVILLSCASCNTYSHTIIAHIRCIDIEGAFFEFLKKCAKWYL
jgi:hypothetical protein